MKKKGRVVVFGIFDGIHAGHRDFLQQARAYGDELFAIVGRDESVVRLKGKTPTYPEKSRIELVAQEEWVSDVLLGDEEPSSYRVLGELNPDVICLGYDQRALRADLEEWMRGRGQKIPMYSLDLITQILSIVPSWGGADNSISAMTCPRFLLVEEDNDTLSGCGPSDGHQRRAIAVCCRARRF